MKTINATPTKKRAKSYLRWSTPRQEWGDSERRQSEAARRYCEEHGLTLCDQVTDRGISSFHGKNMERGLGGLIDAMQPGETLLVEDTDRLSREGWLEVVNILGDLVEKGVTVVTLRDGNVITNESFRRNPGVFLPAILRGFLGNDESHKKGGRIGETWERKRREVLEGKAPKQALPGWLEWNNETGKPALIPGKAGTVKRMFDMAAQGIGCLRIARKLAEDGVPNISKRAGSQWSTDYVHRILTNKACLGHYVTDGIDQPGIYPPVVSEAVFYRVQDALKSRSQHKGVTVRASCEANNLFTKIAVCSECGQPVTMHRQSYGSTNYGYLVCGGTRRNMAKRERNTCSSSGIRYDHIESSFLNLGCQLDAIRESLTGKNEQASQEDLLTAKLQDVQKQIEKVNLLIFGMDNPPKSLLANLQKFEDEQTTIKDQLEEMRAKKFAATPEESLLNLRRLMAGKSNDTDYRVKLKNAIAVSVDKIVVDIAARAYAVSLHGIEGTITVKLDKRGNAVYGV